MNATKKPMETLEESFRLYWAKLHDVHPAGSACVAHEAFMMGAVAFEIMVREALTRESGDVQAALRLAMKLRREANQALWMRRQLMDSGTN